MLLLSAGGGLPAAADVALILALLAAFASVVFVKSGDAPRADESESEKGSERGDGKIEPQSTEGTEEGPGTIVSKENFHASGSVISVSSVVNHLLS